MGHSPQDNIVVFCLTLSVFCQQRDKKIDEYHTLFNRFVYWEFHFLIHRVHQNPWSGRRTLEMSVNEFIYDYNGGKIFIPVTGVLSNSSTIYRSVLKSGLNKLKIRTRCVIIRKYKGRSGGLINLYFSK